VQVANLEATDAQVTLTAYKADGTTDGTPLQDTITANGSKTYFPISNVTNGFQGAIVISSSRRIAAISNILSSDFRAGASYVGSAAGATTVLLPLLNKGNSGFDTWFSVQNAGTAAATVNIAYSDGTTASASIPVGSAKVFYQSQETHSQKVFAGTITSNQPVVAAVIQETRNATTGAGIIFSYTGFTGGSPNPVFPIINANNSGYVTGLQIQNAGTAATEVTVTYTPAGGIGTQCIETQTIQPAASATFALAAFNATATLPGTSDCARGVRFVGAARVTGNSANQPLVGIGNQLLPGANGGAYGAFNADNATNKVVMPLIMDRRGGATNKFFTGFNIQNVGTGTATVSCTFVGDDYTIPATALAAGAALNDLQNGKVADNYAGGATCTAAESGAKIVAIVNELGDLAGADQLLVYEGAISQ
jgi:hypothetical protein